MLYAHISRTHVLVLFVTSLQCVELGANVSAGNPELFGRNALHMAAYHGKTESVRAVRNVFEAEQVFGVEG